MNKLDKYEFRQAESAARDGRPISAQEACALFDELHALRKVLQAAWYYSEASDDLAAALAAAGAP